MRRRGVNGIGVDSSAAEVALSGSSASFSVSSTPGSRASDSDRGSAPYHEAWIAPSEPSADRLSNAEDTCSVSTLLPVLTAMPDTVVVSSVPAKAISP